MTTLTTFRLHLPRSVRVVEVLGSWDNFKQPYPLERDRQAGPGHWRGCHSFKNITCDGSSLDPTFRRDGGLKMGGTYWYYYRLDREVDHHDPIQPSTTACPLLPGQQVNIMEVPIQYEANSDPSSEARRPIDSNVFTLDPNAKYSPRKASTRVDASPNPQNASMAASQHPGRSVSKAHLANEGTFAPPSTMKVQSGEVDIPKTSQGLCVSFPTSASLMAKFHKLRGSRSAPAVEEKVSSSRKGPFKSRWWRATEDGEEKRQRDHETSRRPSNTRTKAPFNSPEFSPPDWNSLDWPPVVAQPIYVAPWTADSPTGQACRSSTSHTIACQGRNHSGTVPTSSRGSANEGHVVHKASSKRFLLSRRSTRRPSRDPTDAASNNDSFDQEAAAKRASRVLDRADITAESGHCSASSAKSQEILNGCSATSQPVSPLILPIQSNSLPRDAIRQERTRADYDSKIHQPAGPPSLRLDNNEILDSLYTLSPTLDGQLSPHYLSRTESPSVRDFEEVWDSESRSHSASQHATFENPPLLGEVATGTEFDPMPLLSSPSFPGYSLPAEEHTSALTLRKQPSAVSRPIPHNDTTAGNDQFVKSWNDGSEPRRMTALDELVNELGYLGQVIV